MLLKREDGVVAVEFVILFPLFMLILVGIVEFGHLFNMRHTLTNASREGARAGVVYTPGTDAARITVAKQAAYDKVKTYLEPVLPADSWSSFDKEKNITVTLNPDTGLLSGGSLQVDVSSDAGLLLLDKLVPAIGDKIKIVSAETTMRME